MLCSRPHCWLPVILALLASMTAANATDHADNPNRPDDLLPAERAEPVIEEGWKEAAVTLPAFPRARDLLPLRAETGDADYNYYIDVNSVTLTSDEVLRYTVVIQAPGGANNIIYEGIRCATKEVKSFAYGTRDGRFERMADPEWRYFRSRGAMGYRTALVERYVCDEQGWAVDSDTVLERLVMHDPRRPRIAPKIPEASD
jgi:hypothetical protein